MRRHLERATRDQTVETLRDRPAPSPASAQFNQTSATVTPQAAPVVAQTEQATATVTPKRPTREAAICLLFCEVDEVPSVLYTVRSPRLRRHTGEISFPGGVRDPSDASPLAAALRETREEIGINEADVTVLGGLPWLPDLTGRMRVYPFCGFVDLAKLGIRRPSEIKGNPTEVARVFHLTVPQLLDPNRRRDLKFRNRDVAYTAFRADDVDLLPELPQSVIETGDLRALADYEHQYGSTVVWGLTGYVTTQVLRIAVEPVVEQLRVAREGSGKG
ncbi:NUDIX hydrolase domain-like protein [Hyaloraphidium curvatum]|nr:NUDIX hydrolase domain-like protein [Hyaloraphidium curvatum]